MDSMRAWPAWILVAPFLFSIGHAQTEALPPVTVTAARYPQPDSEVPFTVEQISGDSLTESPSLTIDDALRESPDFSLFRRDDSLTANPTSQGVSLRGLGPSGASRSLVLLDGMPLNDPFGGWVPWSLVPRIDLAGAELSPGGGATAWGDTALAGVVQLLTSPAAAGSGRAEFQADGFGTRSGEFDATEPAGGGSLELRGDEFASDGFVLVSPDQRGPVDVDAASRHEWGSASWRGSPEPDLEATFTVRGFQEWRDNGTPYQQNESRQVFASADLGGQAGSGLAWTAAAYVQNQGFSQTFSSVNAARTAETPASDQFAVPTTAAGLASTATHSAADGGKAIVGFDARDVRGETREDYFFTGGEFTKLRVAGGRQTLGGLFFEETQPLASTVSATVGLRGDRWEESEGHLRQGGIATGVLSTNDAFPDRTGTEWNPAAGLVWSPGKSLRVRLAAQRSYRLPTLNELYRPFQQGTTITEANPALETEHADTAEMGATWRRGPWRLDFQGFATQLDGAVSNVTVAQGPGVFPYFGTLPAGEVGQERLNLDHVRSDGVQLGGSWRPSEAWGIDFGLLEEDSVVTEARVAPSLVGRALPEVPRTTGTAGFTLHPVAWVRLEARVRWTGTDFDDTGNQLPLAAATVADASAVFTFSRRLEVFAVVDNLADARVETAHSATGVFSVAAPRMLGVGVRVGW
jgi:outer membrane receptor protein involved in Fe transport